MSRISELLLKYKNIAGERFFEELFRNDEYKAVLGVNADVVLDIGACAGEFSAYIYDHAGKIYAIEPYSEHYKELASNIKEFDLDKIKSFNIALSRDNDEGWLSVGNRGSHKLGSKCDNSEKVTTKSLKSFMEDEGIEHVNVLKIDIEDGEYEVFSAQSFSDVAPKIDFIIGEHLGPCDEILKAQGFIRKESINNNAIYQR